MRLILTHEQSDFDALASLFGAYLLDDLAFAVLPRRMNRNVGAFVTLYGAELPFIEARDLPNEAVESVTLVDTQSLITTKGMGPETRIHVIDHHPPRAGLPAHWTLSTEDIGATATLFAEALQERDAALTSIHATLLLLGIYEDTGSLTYSRTTPRDLHAAAYLLENGASLRVASDFLNHPLTLPQQTLYDSLRASAEHHTIHGHAIVIACGDAQGMDEELSTIAHKLRDLLDPDALFVLVATRGGVQLIARSTTDQIDVAAIAAHFGGGGHERAAAGLLKGRDPAGVRDELLSVLPRFVHPATTVAQLMSPDPQVLDPEISVHEAALRMTRFGYEGFPVVKDGKVVGLLTRRAVDRALAHKLNLTAASLMEAGGITAAPDDSAEYLQRLMTSSGWGQIPVIQPQSGEIIGIVTRTDLLKTLTKERRQPAHIDVSERLAAALPAERLALLKIVAQTAHEQRMAAYIVGGFMRDLLLDRPSFDFDIVIEGDAIAIARALAQKHGGRITQHHRFGTAKWFLPEGGRQKDEGGSDSSFTLHPSSLDFVTARTEFYTHPTALPTVERGSIKLDLHRRDFTFNTLAVRLDGAHFGELYDYWGGLSDLRARLVRVLHSLSFVDDPTRMLRAVRFEQRFGFQIETRTAQLLNEALSLLPRLSGDRIRHELDHLLDEENFAAMLARLHELGLLAAIHPALQWDSWLETCLQKISEEKPGPEWGLPSSWQGGALKRELIYTVWLLRLRPEMAGEVLARLKIPRSQAVHILEACRLWNECASLVGQPPSVVVARLENCSMLAIFALWLASTDEPVRRLLHEYAAHWRAITAHTDGDELRRRGLEPGPRYGQILAALRNVWLDGEIASAEEEDVMLEKLIRDNVER